MSHSPLPATLWLQRRWAEFTEETVVLYKSHRYDPELLNLCRETLVLLSHAGSLEATVLSAVNARFMTLEQDMVVSFLQGMFHELFLWRQHASLDLSSEQLKKSPLHSAALVHHMLGAALGMPYKDFDFSKLAKEISRESNPNIPHKKADDETTRRLRQMMLVAKERLAYDKRVIGWKWTADEL